MNTTLATILGTVALGLMRSKMGSGARIIKCDEIKLDYTLRLYAPSLNLNIINEGWSASKFINQAGIVDISIKCVGTDIDHDLPEDIIEEYGEYIYAYFEVFVKLKGRFENIEPMNKSKIFQIILDTIKELWVNNILSLAPSADTEVQTTNGFNNYYSIEGFMNEYNNIDDIIEGFYGSRTSVINSFYVGDNKGNPIDYMTKKDKSKLRKR